MHYNHSKDEKADLEARNALAEKMFPREWQENENLKDGHKRRHRRGHMRDLAVYQTKVAELRAIGACCGNCANASKPHFSFTEEIKFGKLCCDYQSDSQGSVHVKPDNICADWRKRVHHIADIANRVG